MFKRNHDTPFSLSLIAAAVAFMHLGKALRASPVFVARAVAPSLTCKPVRTTANFARGPRPPECEA